MVEGEAVRLLQGHHVRDGLVHHFRALAAESGHHNVSGQAQGLAGIGLGGVKELLTHGHAHCLHPLGVLVILLALLEGHQHPGGAVGRQLGGDAGDGVGLVDTGGDFHALGGIQCREAGIAAGADDCVRLELPENRLAGAHRIQDALHGVDVLFQARRAQLPAEAGTREALDFVARLGHQLLLHVALRADEENLAVRVFLPDLVRHGDGGVNVSCGAAAGENQIHKGSSWIFLWFLYRDICKTIPISPRFTARAVPP